MSDVVHGQESGNIVRGHKANLNNPNTSDESKQQSKQVLENDFDGKDIPAEEGNKSKNPNQVAGGLKATISNPNTSDEAKQSAKERLNEM